MVRTPEPAQAGITLIELMVVIAIVGLLAAIAYPSYTLFVMQTNRTDATKTMQLFAQSLERCYSANFTYLPPGGCTVNGNFVVDGSKLPTPNGYYSIAFSIPDPQDYTLTATAVAAPQTGDSQCQVFTLSSTGQQSAQNSAAVTIPNPQICWGSN